jgi:hypothetical protein
MGKIILFLRKLKFQSHCPIIINNLILRRLNLLGWSGDR